MAFSWHELGTFSPVSVLAGSNHLRLEWPKHLTEHAACFRPARLLSTHHPRSEDRSLPGVQQSDSRSRGASRSQDAGRKMRVCSRRGWLERFAFPRQAAGWLATWPSGPGTPTCKVYNAHEVFLKSVVAELKRCSRQSAEAKPNCSDWMRALAFCKLKTGSPFLADDSTGQFPMLLG